MAGWLAGWHYSDTPLFASSGLPLLQCLQRADQTEQFLVFLAPELKIWFDALYRLVAAENIFAHLPEVEVRSIPVVDHGGVHALAEVVGTNVADGVHGVGVHGGLAELGIARAEHVLDLFVARVERVVAVLVATGQMSR